MHQTGDQIINESIELPSEVKQNVLVIAPEILASTRMVYEIPFRVLSGPAFTWRIISEYYLKIEDLKNINTLILYRCIQDSTLSLARFAHLNQITVIYELDDDLLEPPEDVSWGLRYKISHLSQIIKMFLAEADLIKAGSPELARRLKEKNYPAIYQPYTAKIYDIPVDIIEPPYRIGYFGSPHHQDDIEMVFPALLAIKELLQEQVEFEFIGCYPHQWQKLQARLFPYIADYDLFMKTLTERYWTLGLAPLRTIPFNEAKSNSKFRDYTAAKVLGIYSDLTPYRDSVTNGQNGWLVKESFEEWYEVIQKALSSTKHAVMVQQARNLLQTVYSAESVAQNWLSLLRRFSHN
ncbi:MAG TPA: hypothetical protein DDW50_03500 [Firmicutes bacterium]|jgi:hypothetical protein|nr:hypothetical protein [Bacillota bacterium]